MWLFLCIFYVRYSTHINKWALYNAINAARFVSMLLFCCLHFFEWSETGIQKWRQEWYTTISHIYLSLSFWFILFHRVVNMCPCDCAEQREWTTTTLKLYSSNPNNNNRTQKSIIDVFNVVLSLSFIADYWAVTYGCMFVCAARPSDSHPTEMQISHVATRDQINRETNIHLPTSPMLLLCSIVEWIHLRCEWYFRWRFMWWAPICTVDYGKGFMLIWLISHHHDRFLFSMRLLQCKRHVP